jgi:NAD(P)-dependent dehydrogenase (short-subunit alcohol dehydrogenase family)
MASRSRQRAEEAIEHIKNGYTYSATGFTKSDVKKQGKGSLEFLELDLGDLNSVERFVEEYKGREKRLDILFANAGVMAS